MAQVAKIDSNIVETRYAVETAFKTVGGSEVWRPIEVNSFSDTKATFTKVARNPISSDRQRLKGVTTDLEVSAGFQSDLTQYNLVDLLQGLFFATLSSSILFTTATGVNGSNQITAASGLTVFNAGDLVVLVGGTQAAGNSNRVLRVTASAAGLLTVAQTLVAETFSGAQVIRVGRRAAAEDLEIDASGGLPKLVSTVLDFTTLGIIPGSHIFIGGDAANTFFSVNAVNNSWVRVRSVAANEIVLDKSSKGTLITEASGASDTIEIYFGQVLKNQQLATTVRRTYQLERLLGAPDDSQPTQIQSEYFTGCVFNEAVFNLQATEKVTVDCSFVGADQELRTGATGVKAGTRPSLYPADAHTNNDLKRVRLSKVVAGDEAPVALFTYFPSLTITVNNAVEPLKALTVLGAFDMNAGDFTVSVAGEGFFNNIEAISAVRNNDSLTIDVIEVRNNQGWVIDLPLVTAGDGSINIEKNAAAMVPLTFDCASGGEIDPGLDYTMCMTFYPGLPTRAASPNA
jgi:hypothetical protein